MKISEAENLLEKYVACGTLRRLRKTVSIVMCYFAKKFKQLSFAAGCNCDVIKEGADMMGVPLDEVIADCIAAMREHHAECGV